LNGEKGGKSLFVYVYVLRFTRTGARAERGRCEGVGEGTSRRGRRGGDVEEGSRRGVKGLDGVPNSN
jgi:hypothetical protein